jgi:hypothetical protein
MDSAHRPIQIFMVEKQTLKKEIGQQAQLSLAEVFDFYLSLLPVIHSKSASHGASRPASRLFA